MSLSELPKVTDMKDLKTVRDAFDRIQEEAISIEYGLEAPTKLGFGVLFVVDDGAGTTGVYIKTAEKNIIKI
jgi:hypothetical protein